MWYRIFANFSESSSYFTGNEGIIVLCAALALACMLYVFGNDKKRKLPPGPMGLPIFGYYPFLGKEPDRKLNEIGKKYGNVFGLFLGSKYMVFLNDWDAMEDALGQNTTLDRPSALFGAVPYKLGVAGVNGAEWVETRRFSSKTMKDVGLNSAQLEDLIQDEVSEMIARIIEIGNNPIEVRSFFCDSFVSNVVSLSFGKKLEHGHPIIKAVSDSVDTILEYTPTIGMMNFSPTLSKILQAIGLEKKYLLAEKMQDFAKFISDTVEDRTKNPEFMTDDSFISRYNEGIENAQKRNVQSYLTKDALKGAVIALLAGGSETGRTTLVWTLIAMADYPDKQQKVHEELDKVIGKDGVIRWSDRSKIPYTLASLFESMRWRTTVPLSTIREASEDTLVQGYVIPKGTFISANIWSMHNDPNYWDKPDQFIPERFLLDNGKKVNSSPKSFSPFSYGRRMCPGKLIANMEILQYFIMLMQSFKVVPKEGKKVKYSARLGLTYQALGAELRFIKR